MPLLANQISLNVITGSVANFAALPNVVSSNGRYYNVLAAQGTRWLFTYKPKGIYYSDGVTWDFRGEFPSNANQATVDAGTNDEEFLTSKTFNDSAQLAALSATDTSLQTQINNLVVDSIADGDTTHAPSRNSVFDALASNLASANAYSDSLVVGLWDDRGNYDASSNLFPSTGGSGTAGAILKGDVWTTNIAGTLGGVPVATRQTVRSLVNSPGQTSTNWAIGLANTDIDDSITSGITGRAPSQDAVYQALATKADGTGTANGTNTGDETNASIAAIIDASATVAADSGQYVPASDNAGNLVKMKWVDIFTFLVNAVNVGNYLHGLDNKTTPLDADEFGLVDTADSNKEKKITFTQAWTNYFKGKADALYEKLANKDATGGYVGLTLFKINFKNAANTFTSFFTNANSASRTYTFQNRDGTIADDTDLALKAPLASPALTGNPTAPTQTALDNSTKIATTAYVDARLRPFFFQFANLSAPADSTSYLVSNIPDLTAATTMRLFRFSSLAGTVKECVFTLNQTTNGSNETVTVYLRNITTATDYTIGTFTSDFGASTTKSFSFTGLSIAINSTDDWCIKILTPAWGTNPSAWRLGGNLYIQ